MLDILIQLDTRGRSRDRYAFYPGITEDQIVAVADNSLLICVKSNLSHLLPPVSSGLLTINIARL